MVVHLGEGVKGSQVMVGALVVVHLEEEEVVEGVGVALAVLEVAQCQELKAGWMR